MVHATDDQLDTQGAAAQEQKGIGKKEQKKQHVHSEKQHLNLNHPIAAWLLENGCIIGIARLRASIPPPSKTSYLAIATNTFAGGLLVIEGCILAQKVLIDWVYWDVAFFSHDHLARSRPPLREVLDDWLRCNFRTHLFASVLLGYLIRYVVTEEQYKKINSPSRKFRLGRFLFKLAIVRVVADMVFYVVHRALHSRYLYHLHKRHHEHKATGIPTNFHFSVVDLILEGFVPLFVGVRALDTIFKVVSSPFEQALFAGYLQWYEIGSHSGKPVPTVTYFPPFAPLYCQVLGNVDARNIEFHDNHHALTNCNYGITQWLDWVLGTAKFAKQNRKQKSSYLRST